MTSPRTKGRTATELAIHLDEVLDGLKEKSIPPDVAGHHSTVANTRLRIELGRIENARARGEKPNIPFFQDLVA